MESKVKRWLFVSTMNYKRQNPQSLVETDKNMDKNILTHIKIYGT
jgi:hypothetical protein